VCNGNPSSHEYDKGKRRCAFNGLCQVILQSTMDEGNIILHADSPGLVCDEVEIMSIRWKG
jgi:beta-galactosidase